MTVTPAATRRTLSTRTGGRAADVVDRIVWATIEELGRVGYEAMRVEDVAARSGVNKTTIYRRWPTKAELVTVAVTHQSQQSATRIDTGTLRGDLRASLLQAFELSTLEQGVLRVVQTERALKDVDALARKMRDAIRRQRIALVRRGVRRGELPAGVDEALIVDVASAPVQKALLFNETMDAAEIDRVLDVVLAGAAAVATARPSPPERAPKSPGSRGTQLTTRSATRTRRGSTQTR